MAFWSNARYRRFLLIAAAYQALCTGIGAAYYFVGIGAESGKGPKEFFHIFLPSAVAIVVYFLGGGWTVLTGGKPYYEGGRPAERRLRIAEVRALLFAVPAMAVVAPLIFHFRN